MNALETELKRVNGRRRVRTLTVGDVPDVQEGEVQFVHAGHVANAYKYPAWATAVLVGKHDGKTYAIVREVSAKKGSSGFGRIAEWSAEDIAKNPEAVEVQHQEA